MHWLRFLAYNALGAALWVGTWVSIGYFAGQHINAIYSVITRYSLYVAIAAVVVIVALIARHVMRKRRGCSGGGWVGRPGSGGRRFRFRWRVPEEGETLGDDSGEGEVDGGDEAADAHGDRCRRGERRRG